MKSSVNIRYIVNGKDAQRMWLVPSASFIVRSDGPEGAVYAPDSISCKVIRQVGAEEATEMTSGFTLKYRRNASGDGVPVASGVSVQVHPSGDEPTNTVDFSLFNTGGVEVDRFTARVIDSGANGLSPDYTVFRFKQSESVPQKPTGTTPNPQGWSDRCNNPSNTVTPWWMTMNVVSGATGQVPANGWSYPVQVTGEDGLPGLNGGYTSYKFAKNTDPYNHPDFTQVDTDQNWQDGPPEISKGEYCWMTFATFDGKGGRSPWSTPIRITPIDSVDYVLELSCDSVQVTPKVGDTAAFATPPTVSATVWKVEGGERTDVTAQSTIKYEVRNASGAGIVRNYSGAITVPTTARQIIFTLYENNLAGAKAIGSKTIPVTTLVPGPPGETPDPVPGDAAVVKWIELTPSVVTRQLDGSYAPTSLICKCLWRRGAETEVHESEGEEVGIYLPTDTDFNDPLDTTNSGEGVGVASVAPRDRIVSSLVFRNAEYGTATLAIQRLVKPGVVRCRAWGEGENITDVQGNITFTIYDYQNGNDTEYLDVVKKGKDEYYVCIQSFRLELRPDQAMNEKYEPGSSSDGWGTYWEQVSTSHFAAFGLILTEKAKVKNLYVDEVVIPETDEDGNEVSGKYAMVANSKGIHMTGTITAQAMSLDVDTPANGALLGAPLNIVKVPETADASSAVTLYLPCLMPGTTRQIDILVVGGAGTDFSGYRLLLVGSQTDTGYTAKPMAKGCQDEDNNCIEFKGNLGIMNPGSPSIPATDILGLYRCIGFCLKNETTTWWECIRLNDGADAKGGISGMAVPSYTHHNYSVDQVPWEPMTEGQFIKGGTIHNTITTIN